MSKQRKVCADSCHPDRNCPHARIVEEHGEYPTVTFQATLKNGKPDLTTMHNVRRGVDTTCSCVYCTHPRYIKGEFIGSVEPYFPCPAPSNCPLQKK